MDYGVFLPVANNGWITSETAPQYMPTFELNKEICERAEAGGFDFALGMVKLRGYGGRTEHWDYAADSFALLAGLAAATSRLRLYATVATLTMHPAVTARMAVTINDISGGRFGVNVVSGWNKLEYSQMGLWPGDDYYQGRYDYTTEYVEVMKELWEKGEVTHTGEHFTLESCFCKPTPEHPIPLVFAGQSARGMELAARHGDYTFMIGGSVEEVGTLCDRLRQATTATGREVGAYALYGIIAAPTDEEARATAEHYLAGTDHEALANQMATADGDKGGTIGTVLGSEREMLPSVDFLDDVTPAIVQGACFGSPQLVGSYDRVAGFMGRLEDELGLAGVILTFADFPAGVTDFSEQVLPRVRARRTAEVG